MFCRRHFGNAMLHAVNGFSDNDFGADYFWDLIFLNLFRQMTILHLKVKSVDKKCPLSDNSV